MWGREITVSIQALVIDEKFVDVQTSQALLSRINEEDWVPTVPEGAYATDQWRVIKLIDSEEK